jgi:hypothetical protein
MEAAVREGHGPIAFDSAGTDWRLGRGGSLRQDRPLPPSRPACNSLNSGNIVNTVGLVFDDETRKKK